MKQSYWIQEQAPAGNYFDSIGLPPTTTKVAAIKELRSWQRTFSNRVCRLIRRTDEVIAGPLPPPLTLD